MTQQLALKYRPFSFRELTAQHATRIVLYRMVHDREHHPLPEHKIPPALLFHGGKGSGKTSTARIVAAALNCAHPGVRPCGSCPSCTAIRDGRSLDVIEIDAASAGGVAEIRAIKEMVAYMAAGPVRVVILDEAHSMSRDAFNALLKVLEEPPPATIFILVTTEAARILPTVASRCMWFAFRRIEPRDIRTRLREICAAEHISADEQLLAEISERADGALRDAVMALDQMARIGVSSLAHFEQIMGPSDPAPTLVAAMADGNPAVLFARLDKVAATADPGWIATRLTACCKDILVLATGGSCPALGQSLAARQALAARLPADQVAAALRVLWDLRGRHGTGDPRAGLDLAAVQMMGKLCPRPVAPKGNGNGHRKLTVTEMAAMAGAAECGT